MADKNLFRRFFGSLAAEGHDHHRGRAIPPTLLQRIPDPAPTKLHQRAGCGISRAGQVLRSWR